MEFETILLSLALAVFAGMFLALLLDFVELKKNEKIERDLVKALLKNVDK